MSASFRQALNIRYPRDRKAAHDRPLTIADGQGPATFGRSTSEPKSLTIPVGLFTHSTNGKSCRAILSCRTANQRSVMVLAAC